jgi:hypothetical protein
VKAIFYDFRVAVIPLAWQHAGLIPAVLHHRLASLCDPMRYPVYVTRFFCFV